MINLKVTNLSRAEVLQSADGRIRWRRGSVAYMADIGGVVDITPKVVIVGGPTYTTWVKL